MKPLRLFVPSFLCCSLLLLTGCEPVPHYYQTKVASLTTAPAEVGHGQQGKVKPYGTVKYFADTADVHQPYTVIGLMSVEGDPGDEACFVTAFLYRAADMDADAVVMLHGSQNREFQSTPGFGNHEFAIGGTAKSSDKSIFRAQAIKFDK